MVWYSLKTKTNHIFSRHFVMGQKVLWQPLKEVFRTCQTSMMTRSYVNVLSQKICITDVSQGLKFTKVLQNEMKKFWFTFRYVGNEKKTKRFNSFSAKVSIYVYEFQYFVAAFLCLKTSENQKFSDVFRGCNIEKLLRNSGKPWNNW